MRHVVTCALVLASQLSAASARADETDLQLRAMEAELAQQRQLRLVQDTESELHRGRMLRSAGIGLTVSGIVLTIVGASAFAYGVLSSFCYERCERHPGTGDGATVLGGVMLGVGQVANVAGITLWATGAVQAKQAGRKRLALSTSGATLTF